MHVWGSLCSRNWLFIYLKFVILKKTSEKNLNSFFPKLNVIKTPKKKKKGKVTHFKQHFRWLSYQKVVNYIHILFSFSIQLVNTYWGSRMLKTLSFLQGTGEWRFASEPCTLKGAHSMIIECVSFCRF